MRIQFCFCSITSQKNPEKKSASSRRDSLRINENTYKLTHSHSPGNSRKTAGQAVQHQVILMRLRQIILPECCVLALLFYKFYCHFYRFI